MRKRASLYLLIALITTPFCFAQNDWPHWRGPDHNGVVHCFDLMTGEEIYGRQRLRNGTYSSSLVLADGNLYATSEDGITTVFKAGPEFEVLSENDLRIR